MAEVYRGVVPPVRSLAQRMLGSGPDADDVAGEVVVEIFARAGELDAEGDALAWALTIAVWRCRTERKRRARRRTEPLGEGADEPVAQGRDPEEVAIAREARAALEAAVGTLGVRDREALDAVLGGAPLSAALRKRKERLLLRLRRMLIGEEAT